MHYDQFTIRVKQDSWGEVNGTPRRLRDIVTFFNDKIKTNALKAKISLTCLEEGEREGRWRVLFPSSLSFVFLVGDIRFMRYSVQEYNFYELREEESKSLHLSQRSLSFTFFFCFCIRQSRIIDVEKGWSEIADSIHIRNTMHVRSVVDESSFI